jgi:glutamate mutase epsilon subunit
MSEKQIHLIVTPQQAKSLAASLALVKQILAVAPNTPVYPNLGDFHMERELIKAEINAAQVTLLKQMEGQMPKE